MISLRELRDKQAELTGLRELLKSATDLIFERPLLQSKISEREDELLELERHPVSIAPEAELLFGGRPVFGSVGIDAKFASAVLDSYQDMVSNHHGAKIHPGMGKAGPRPGEQESRLCLSALPRGSFGLFLTQPNPTNFVAAQQVAEAMEELTSLVESAAAGDAAFAQGVERFHPRVLVPLGKFFEALSTRGASVTIRSGRRETSLNFEKVEAARNRIVSTTPETNTVNFSGIFRGVLLESWRFDFVPDDQNAISGLLSESVTEEEAKAMVSLCDLHCEAELKETRFRTHGNLGRPSYELLNLKRSIVTRTVIQD